MPTQSRRWAPQSRRQPIGSCRWVPQSTSHPHSHSWRPRPLFLLPSSHWSLSLSLSLPLALSTSPPNTATALLDAPLFCWWVGVFGCLFSGGKVGVLGWFFTMRGKQLLLPRWKLLFCSILSFYCKSCVFSMWVIFFIC